MQSVLIADVRVGDIIVLSDEKWFILGAAHSKPTKSGSFITLELKEITSNRKLTTKLNILDKTIRIPIRKELYVYSFKEGTTITFSHSDTYEPLEVDQKIFEPFECFIEDGAEVFLEFIEESESPVKGRIVKQLIGTIANTSSITKNALGSLMVKDAVLHNGYIVSVPDHLDVGTEIVIDSYTGTFKEKYLSRYTGQ